MKNEEEMRAKWNEFNVSLTQDVTPPYKEIVNEDMLNVAVVRDVCLIRKILHWLLFGLLIFPFLRVLRNYMFC